MWNYIYGATDGRAICKLLLCAMSAFDMMFGDIGADELSFIMDGSQPLDADADALASAAKEAVLEDGGRLPVSQSDLDAAVPRVEGSSDNWEPAFDAASAAIGGDNNADEKRLRMFIAKDVSVCVCACLVTGISGTPGFKAFVFVSRC